MYEEHMFEDGKTFWDWARKNATSPPSQVT